MGATRIDIKISATVDKYENLPPWIIALSELTSIACDDLVQQMLESELHASARAFMEKFPDLFVGDLA